MSGDHEGEQANKDRVGAAFDAWAAGTGGPFDLLADDATWTIVGNSPVSETYGSKVEFTDLAAGRPRLTRRRVQRGTPRVPPAQRG